MKGFREGGRGDRPIKDFNVPWVSGNTGIKVATVEREPASAVFCGDASRVGSREGVAGGGPMSCAVNVFWEGLLIGHGISSDLWTSGVSVPLGA